MTRRTFLGVAGAAVVTGCSSGTSPSGRPSGGDEGEPAPDVAVATSALAAVRATHVAVTATRHRFPDLRRELAGLLDLHEAHQDSLTDAVPGPSRRSAGAAPYVVPKRRPAAEAKLRDAETQLQGQLNSLARRARSGEFARLLASMGAGLAQQLEDWQE